MKFVARLLVLVVATMSFSMQSSVAANNEAVLVSQSPLWVLKNQAVEFVVKSETALQDVTLYISQSPLIGRSSLDSYLKDSLNVSFRKLDNIAITLEANLTTVILNSLSLPTSGVYVVDIRSGDTSIVTSLISYSKSANINPLNTVILWPISSPPAVSPQDESLVDDYWQQNSGLIESVKSHPIDERLSWLLDSDVISWAASSGNTDWINALKTGTSNSDVYVAPYANSDVNALIKARKMKLAVAAISSILPVTSALERSNIPRAIAGTSFSPKTWDWIEKQGLYLSITSNQQYPSSTSVFTPSGIVTNPNQNKSLVVDRRASKFMSQALSVPAVQNLQLLQADLFITALEQPQANRTLVLHPTVWDMGDGAKEQVLDIFTTSWLKPIAASDAMRKPVTDQRSLVSTKTSTLSKKQLDLITRLETYRKRLAPFIAETIHDTQTIHAGLRVSSIFDTNRQIVAQSTENFFNNLLNAVTIVSSGTVIFAGESGVIPITIRNDLSVPVYVNVLGQGFPEVRVDLGTVDFVEIGAGQRKSIEIPATLYGSESAFVELQLVDALGKKIGEIRRIEIASSAYSTIAGVFVSIAFALLFLLLIYNTQKRIRASRATALENSPRE